jgi:hypothetical protein
MNVRIFYRIFKNNTVVGEWGGALLREWSADDRGHIYFDRVLNAFLILERLHFVFYRGNYGAVILLYMKNRVDLLEWRSKYSTVLKFDSW